MPDQMERRNKILNHDLFKRCIDRIEAAERDRRFCRHNMAHFLDVARLAMILREKDGIESGEDWIYAAALLHDIGRHVQYENGTPHELASAQIAAAILRECGFDHKETAVIVEAIRMHRNQEAAEQKNLNGLLYRADKMSRSCFACAAEKDCDWKQEKKNLLLQY